MARDLAQLIRRRGDTVRSQAVFPAAALPYDAAIIDREVARRLGKRAAPRAPWISERDLADALMTFALTFTGAMIFLL